MKNIFKSIFLVGAFILFIASPVISVVTPQTAHAAGCDESGILGMPPWYRGLVKEVNGNCEIASPNEAGGLETFIWRIVLNVIEIGLVAASLVAVFFILFGGFLFLTGGGNTAQTEKAIKSILNAVIGLVISLGAVAVTNLIFNVLLGGSSSTNDYGIKQIDANTLVANIINLAYYIAGIVAVIVIIIAGIMYASSMGNSGRIIRAKNMILYAVIGLVVLFAAWAITNFVLQRF